MSNSAKPSFRLTAVLASCLDDNGQLCIMTSALVGIPSEMDIHTSPIEIDVRDHLGNFCRYKKEGHAETSAWIKECDVMDNFDDANFFKFQKVLMKLKCINCMVQCISI